MRISSAILVLGLSLTTGLATAATPSEFLKEFSSAAQLAQPGFSPSAERGKAFYQRRFGASATLEACASCHTDNPQQGGKHVVTGKAIAALSPLANAERFTDSKKVDKWFRRNCTEVVGRECSAAEKADLLQFLLKG